MHPIDFEDGGPHGSTLLCSVLLRFRCRRSILCRRPPSGGFLFAHRQSIKDRARPQRSTARARRYQDIKGSPDLAELRDLALNLVPLAYRSAANIATIGARIGPQRKKLFDLTQGETKFLGLPDEANALDDLFIVAPKTAAARARRLPDQTASLVETYGLDAAPRAWRQD